MSAAAAATAASAAGGGGHRYPPDDASRQQQPEHAEAAAAAAATASAPPAIVFQCRKCLAVLGDNYAQVSGNQELQMICLARTVGVKLSRKRKQAQGGFDKGCTFLPVSCASCDAAVGKRYLTTSRVLDAMRDGIALSTEALKGYQLGCAPEPTPEEEAAAGAGPAPEMPPMVLVGFDAERALEARVNSVKIQSLILSLRERVEALEHRLEQVERRRKKKTTKPKQQQQTHKQTTGNKNKKKAGGGGGGRR